VRLGRLFLALAAILVLWALFTRGKNRTGKYRTRKARQLRRAFLIAAGVCAVIDALAVASGGVSGTKSVLELVATTVVPFTYLYWRFGGSFLPGRQ
jgi:hypothetical protein